MTVSIMTVSIMTVSTMTVSIKTISTVIFNISKSDAEHDTIHNVVML
jgi:hypothetical protein